MKRQNASKRERSPNGDERIDPTAGPSDAALAPAPSRRSTRIRNAASNPVEVKPFRSCLPTVRHSMQFPLEATTTTAHPREAQPPEAETDASKPAAGNQRPLSNVNIDHRTPYPAATPSSSSAPSQEQQPQEHHHQSLVPSAAAAQVVKGVPESSASLPVAPPGAAGIHPPSLPPAADIRSPLAVPRPAGSVPLPPQVQKDPKILQNAAEMIAIARKIQQQRMLAAQQLQQQQQQQQDKPGSHAVDQQPPLEGKQHLHVAALPAGQPPPPAPHVEAAPPAPPHSIPSAGIPATHIPLHTAAATSMPYQHPLPPAQLQNSSQHAQPFPARPLLPPPPPPAQHQPPFPAPFGALPGGTGLAPSGPSTAAARGGGNGIEGAGALLHPRGAVALQKEEVATSGGGGGGKGTDLAAMYTLSSAAHLARSEPASGGGSRDETLPQQQQQQQQRGDYEEGPSVSGASGSPGLNTEENTGGDAANGKKARLIWTQELHNRFINALSHLGLKNAVPKTILSLMNVDGMTRENVASHLQKYRLYLKKIGGYHDRERIEPEVLQSLHEKNVQHMAAQQAMQLSLAAAGGFSGADGGGDHAFASFGAFPATFGSATDAADPAVVLPQSLPLSVGLGQQPSAGVSTFASAFAPSAMATTTRVYGPNDIVEGIPVADLAPLPSSVPQAPGTNATAGVTAAAACQTLGQSALAASVPPLHITPAAPLSVPAGQPVSPTVTAAVNAGGHFDPQQFSYPPLPETGLAAAAAAQGVPQLDVSGGRGGGGMHADVFAHHSPHHLPQYNHQHDGHRGQLHGSLNHHIVADGDDDDDIDDDIVGRDGVLDDVDDDGHAALLRRGDFACGKYGPAGGDGGAPSGGNQGPDRGGNGETRDGHAGHATGIPSRSSALWNNHVTANEPDRASKRIKLKGRRQGGAAAAATKGDEWSLAEGFANNVEQEQGHADAASTEQGVAPTTGNTGSGGANDDGDHPLLPAGPHDLHLAVVHVERVQPPLARSVSGNGSGGKTCGHGNGNHIDGASLAMDAATAGIYAPLFDLT